MSTAKIFEVRQVELARDYVYEQLLDAIVAGRLGPGARILERNIAQELGVSTTPVKEAIRKLEQDGLLTTEPRRGARVSDAAKTSLEEMNQIRAMLESLAAGWAARKYNHNSGAHLRRVVDELRLVDPTDRAQEARLIELHSSFHKEIRALAGNLFVDRFVRIMISLDTSMRRRAMSFLEEAQRAWSEHFEIFELISSGDETRAASLTKEHILKSVDFVVHHMEGEETVDGPKAGNLPNYSRGGKAS